MPFVSKNVNIDGKKYLDGGISDSIPIEKILDMDFDKVIVVLTRPIDYRKNRGNQFFAKIYYRKYPNLIKAIEKRAEKYNEQVEKIIKLENEKKIFVIRPSKLVDIKRIEKDSNKIQEMYDLGREDSEKLLQELNEYLLSK